MGLLGTDRWVGTKLIKGPARASKPPSRVLLLVGMLGSHFIILACCTWQTSRSSPHVFTTKIVGASTNLVTRSYRLETIASRLEAITSNKKLIETKACKPSRLARLPGRSYSAPRPPHVLPAAVVPPPRGRAARPGAAAWCL